jgi:hypothetical protein
MKFKLEKKIYHANEKLPIPPEGSLGLLALGYKGVIAWRKAREAAKINTDNKESKE